MLTEIIKDLQKERNQDRAEKKQFFKVGKGEYAEGDVFIGVTMPKQRKIARKYAGLNMKGIEMLLKSKVHEYRLVGLFILINKYKKADEKTRGNLFNFYINNLNRVNNWDLVDSSAHLIIGDFLLNKDKSVIYELAESSNLWKKRIAIVSTFAFIREGKINDTFRISEILLNDEHDLIHKAVGWMLREAGKVDQEALEKFLRKHYKAIPRTMLRYAIERFNEKLRKKYLRGNLDGR